MNIEYIEVVKDDNIPKEFHPYQSAYINVNGTVVECNTAYEGARNTTEKHQKLMKDHKWSKYFEVDIMDREGEYG